MISTTYHPIGFGSCCCAALGPYRQAQEKPIHRSVMQGTNATQFIVGANISRQLTPRVKGVVNSKCDRDPGTEGGHPQGQGPFNPRTGQEQEGKALEAGTSNFPQR